MTLTSDRKIIVKDVHKYFGKKHVLKGIDFHLPDGENLAIIGPNGSGKTTLLRTLASIYLPDKGSIQIGPYDLVTQTRQARRLLSYVSPNLSFHKKLTLRETLDYFSDLQGVEWRNQQELMDDIDLTRMLDSPIEGFPANHLLEDLQFSPSPSHLYVPAVKHRYTRGVVSPVLQSPQALH